MKSNRNKTRMSLICAVMLSLHFSASAVAEENCEFGAPHPGMPGEFGQYDFLIGDFEVRIRVWLGDHWSEQYQRARWIGRYILGGRAISEEWYPKDPADDPDGPGGVNVRMYDPEEQIWKLLWMRSDELVPTELRSEVREDGHMYLWRVYPTPDDRKIWFETYDENHWARLDYRRSESGDDWIPQYKLDAVRRESACGPDGQSADRQKVPQSEANRAVVAYPKEPGARHSTIAVNDIQMHVAEMGDGPLVLFLHGFPELWYSWRHQLPVVAASGYHAVAIDMRGFGETDRPAAREAYNVRKLCADVTGVMDFFGADDAVVVGHDWGAAVTFYCAQLVPERYRGMVTMSVPYGGPRTETPPLQRLRERFGENFFYMLYFQSDAARLELDERVRELFEKIMVTPGTPRGDPLISSSLASAGGWLDRIGYPERQADWLSAEDLDYYVDAFEHSGFLGGLNYYRNLDDNWRILRESGARTMNAPALFIGGEKDFLLGQQTASQLEEAMKTVTPNIDAYVLPGTGHWIQNEKPDEVNDILIAYLNALEP